MRGPADGWRAMRWRNDWANDLTAGTLTLAHDEKKRPLLAQRAGRRPKRALPAGLATLVMRSEQASVRDNNGELASPTPGGQVAR